MTLQESIRYDIGTGVYSVANIAFILRLPRKKVRPWLKDFLDGKLGKDEQKHPRGKSRVCASNFMTMIEFNVYYHLRTAGISNRRIAKLYHELADRLNSVYPFATSTVLNKEHSLIFSDYGHLIPDTDHYDELLLNIQDFATKVDFSATGLAESFCPLGIESHVIFNPHHKFGMPTIKHTNLLVELIYDMYLAGESKAFISRLYDITLQEIDDSIYLFKDYYAA